MNGVAGVEKYGRQVWVIHPANERVMTQLTGEELILNHARDMETLARKCVRHALTCDAVGVVVVVVVMVVTLVHIGFMPLLGKPSKVPRWATLRTSTS